MITTPIFTRVLSTEQYGLYSTYLSWESLLLMITSLSLFKAMMNLYVKYDNQEHILSTVSGLTLVLTIFWFVIAIFIKDILAEILGLTPVLVVCMF
ncbi:oligosaccharide flippase family protein, partial [Enterococcus faecium]|nr:oligosaccharide flippase family protein [Enterococcus faecium]